MTEPTPLPRRPRQTAADDIEGEISDLLQRRAAQPVIMPAVDTNLGRMSAEAVLAQYEAAAKAVEEMGGEIKDRIRRLEAALTEADETMKKLAEAAKGIRDQGKRVQVQIEEASAVSSDIRAACIEVMRKVGA